jgi:hypothetical protein
MRKSSIIVCLCWISFSAQAQQLILTKEQNDAWIIDLDALSLTEKLHTIRLRMLSDTNVFTHQFYPDNIKVNDSLSGKVYGYGKPTFVIGGYLFVFENDTKSSTIKKVAKYLTPTYIDSVIVLSPNDPATVALYGLSSQSGILLMTLSNRRYSKIFRDLSRSIK